MCMFSFLDVFYRHQAVHVVIEGNKGVRENKKDKQ